MKKAQTILLLFLLFIPLMTFAQTSRSVKATANKSWTKFFAEFRTAVTKRDSSALKPMISAEFDWTAGELGISPDDVLWNLDNDGKWRKGKPNMWKMLQKALVINRFVATDYDKRLARSNYSKNNDPYVFFVFEADGRWRWKAFLGD